MFSLDFILKNFQILFPFLTVPFLYVLTFGKADLLFFGTFFWSKIHSSQNSQITSLRQYCLLAKNILIKKIRFSFNVHYSKRINIKGPRFKASS